MIEQLKTIREALERLSCLGNGSHYGNSDGNRIAQEVLPLARQLESLVGEQEPICWAESDGEGGILWDRDSCFSDDPAWFDSPMPLYAAPVAQQQEPKFWYRPVGDDGLYEGPVHNNSIGGKMLRDEKPGEWVPLFEGAAPPAQQYEAGDVASAAAQGFWDGVASVAQQQEPVAWAMPKGDGTFIDVITPAEHARDEGSYTVPLFAHPVAQQPQAKPHKPLFADLIAQHPGLREELLEMDKQPQAEKRCQYCDGTGDVHSIDGQWRGECHCQKQPQAEVGNSGFDHKTAADFLSGKTVSDEAVRKFVQAARWSHDDRASLQSTLLSVRNELASREAEITLLKKELMAADAAPQQAEAVPSDVVRDAERYRWLAERTNEWRIFRKHGKHKLPFRMMRDGDPWGQSFASADEAIDAAIAQQKGQP